MKKVFLFALLFAATTLYAQILEPVKWNTASEPLGNNEFMLTLNADIEQGWFLYSQNLDEGGPIPTTFGFDGVNAVKLLGKVEEVGKMKEGFDEMFEMTVKKYANKVAFKAKVKTTADNTTLVLPVMYMSCNDEKCVKLDDEFVFALKNEAPAKKTPPPPPPVKTETKSSTQGKTNTSPSGNTSSRQSNTTTKKVNSGGLIDNTTTTPSRGSRIISNGGNSNSRTNIVAPSSAPIAQNTATKGEEKSGKKKKLLLKKKKKKKINPDSKEADKGDSDEANSAPTKNNAQQANNGQGFFDPVSWRFEQQDLGNDEYLLKVIADIEPGWYVYSQELEEGGALPTTFTYQGASGVEMLLEKPMEVSEHKKQGMDPVWEMEVIKYSKNVSFEQKVKIADLAKPVLGEFKFMTCDDERCLPPTTEKFVFQNGVGQFADGNIDIGNIGGTQAPIEGLKSNAEIQEAATPWGIFWGGFLGGLLALLTPCVFPMIPLTVSFFTKGSEDRTKGITNALIYALSIIVIYVILGWLVTSIFGATAMSELATNPWVNIAFFVVFMIFAFSFFGFYEITLPNWLANKSDQAADKGGLIGIFFMAFTLAVVSFSCTGPIIGTLLVQAAAGGNTMGPIMGMFGFALALAIPFALFAAFPSWLSTLPQSGGWLNSVKVVLGFLEVALALKFLSNADLVEQWGLLKRETFLVLWVIIFIALGFYLLGKIKFPHDSPLRKLSPARIGLALVAFLFSGYLAYGVPGNSLPLISGFPPPDFYSYNYEGEHCPLDLPCIHDYDEGMEIAKRTGKPVMVDFTGWACVNCRRMEENVWSQPEVLKKLAEDYVLVSLYVDEKKEMPTGEQFEYTNKKGRTKKAVTVGDKWAQFQISCFGSNSQPKYVLLNHNEEMLKSETVGYTSVEKFNTFLDAGLLNFKEGKAEAKLACRQ